MKNNSCPISLPKGWKMSNESYTLKNDQGLNFVANLISPGNKVISMFKADKDLDISTFDLMIADYGEITDKLKLKKKFSMKFGEISFPIYIIESTDGALIAQGFTEHDDLVYSFVTFLDQAGKDYKEYCALNPVLKELASLMRSAS